MGPTFLQREFVSDSKLRPSKETFRNAATELSRAIETRLVPRSHIIQTHCFLSFTTKMVAFRENYLRPAKKTVLFTKSWWIPKCTNRNKLGHQQKVHIPRSLQAATKRLCARLCFQPTSYSQTRWVRNNRAPKGPFQTSISCKLQRCIIDSAQDKPANPFLKKSAKAYSMLFQPSHIPPLFTPLPTSKYAVLLDRKDLRSSSNSSDSSFLW